MISWASYQIRKIAGCACAGNAGNVFPRHRLQRKPLVSDPDMHHGTCVTHVPWCMSGSLTRGGGENVPGIPGACANLNLTYLARGPLIETVDAKSGYHLTVSYRHLVYSNCRIWYVAVQHWNETRIADMLNNISLPELWLLMLKSIWLIKKLWPNSNAAMYSHRTSVSNKLQCNKVLVSINTPDKCKYGVGGWGVVALFVKRYTYTINCKLDAQNITKRTKRLQKHVVNILISNTICHLGFDSNAIYRNWLRTVLCAWRLACSCLTLHCFVLPGLWFSWF